jgi:hypothetical protein
VLRDALVVVYEHWFWTTLWLFMAGGAWAAGQAAKR